MNTAAILMVGFGATVMLADVSLYASLWEAVGFAVLVAGLGLINVGNRRYAIWSFALIAGLLLTSLCVDYALAKRNPDGMLVPFGEYLGECLDHVTLIALILSLAIQLIASKVRQVDGA